jgi:hypothetical protein
MPQSRGSTVATKRRKSPQSKKKERAMSVEYLLVVFKDDRAVLADGDSVGVTNHTLMLPTNEYEISLAGDGYAPKSQDIILAGTSIVRPKVVTFS